MKMRMIWSLLAVVGLFPGINQLLWCQTDFNITIYATDGSGWRDSVVLGRYVSATNTLGDSLSPSLCERELPPHSPGGPNQSADIRLVAPNANDYPSGLGTYGAGYRVDLRHLSSDIQKDVYRIRFRRSDPGGSAITLSWQPGLSYVSGGGFALWDDQGLFLPIDMTKQTSVTYPDQGYYETEAEVFVGDGARFTSIPANVLAWAEDEKGRISGASVDPRRKPIASEGVFTFTNGTGATVDGLQIEWSQAIIGHPKTGPFTVITPQTGEKSQKIIYTGGTVPNGAQAILKVRGNRPKNIRALRWHWLSGMNAGIETRSTPADAGTDRLVLPMPNMNNIGEELYAAGAFDASDGLTVGLASSPKRVIHPKKWSLVAKTLYKKGLLHTGPPACLSVDIKGKPIDRPLRSLPPSDIPPGGNALLSELIALKFNIAAAAYGLTETPGFGDLIYKDYQAYPGPYTGMRVSEIAKMADSAISCEGNGRGLGLETLTRVINSINLAFWTGTIDTLQFGLGTKLKGAKPLVMCGWLYRASTQNGPGTSPNLGAILNSVPEKPSIAQNYPNPFNPTTEIKFSLAKSGNVKLTIFDILGRTVATLLDEKREAGSHAVQWNAAEVATGVYFYQLRAGDFVEVRKMVLMR